MFRDTMEEMEELDRYHSMMWLVEATYGDYAFFPARDFDRVVALTLKDIPDSNQFVFIFPNEKNKEKVAFVESVWEVNWVSLLPLALDKSMRFLMQVAVSATLQVPDELLRPGIWCKEKEMESKLTVFLPLTERRRGRGERAVENRHVYEVKTKKTNEKGLHRHMTNAFTGNMNATIPFFFTRAKLQKYSRSIDQAVREVIMSEIEEDASMTVNDAGCINFLMVSLMRECDYYVPFMDPIEGAFQSLCKNRKKSGLYLINFAPYCKKSVHRDLLVCCESGSWKVMNENGLFG